MTRLFNQSLQEDVERLGKILSTLDVQHVAHVTPKPLPLLFRESKIRREQINGD